jgi:hypothetical protein
MNPIDFMGWLDRDLGNDPEVVLAGLDEHMRLELGDLLKQNWVKPEDRTAAMKAASILLEIIHKAGGKLDITVEFNGETHQVTQ